MKKPLTGLQIWGAPILLAMISAIGLIVALLHDGIGDIASWIALAVPVVVALWYAGRRA